MLSFSEVKRYINDNPAVTRFKPWWDIAIDFLLIGLFLLNLICWSRTFSVEVGGLICIPLTGDASGAATSDIRYIQSRCFDESGVNRIKFYPYFLLLQWSFMFLCQISWVWIPSVTAKFNYFHTIFDEITQVEPHFSINSFKNGILPDLDYSTENRDKLRIIHDKITFMLMDKNYLSLIYRRKSYLLTILITCSIIITMMWISITEFLESNFSCILDSGEARKRSVAMVCNIAPQLYMYGIMLLHMTILILMFILSIKSVIWHRAMCVRVKEGTDMFFGLFSDNFRGLPGYQDLALILELFNSNYKDGKYLLNAVIYVLTGKYDLPSYNLENDSQNEDGGNFRKFKYNFWEEFCIVNYTANELGFEIKDYTQNSNYIFSCLEKIYKQKFKNDFEINFCLREKIVEEINNNIGYYKHIGEAGSNFPPCTIKPVPKDFKYSLAEKLKDICNNGWPDHLILLAAANLLEIKIVLITADMPLNGDIFSSDFFKPYDSQKTQSTIIFLFINPHYYYELQDMKNCEKSCLDRRVDFIRSGRFRNRLRQNSIRKVGDAVSNQGQRGKGRRIQYHPHEAMATPRSLYTDPRASYEYTDTLNSY